MTNREACGMSDGEHEIVLASDGYPLAHCAATSSQGIWGETANAYLPTTLIEAERVLAVALKDDPYCCLTNVSTKGIRPGQRSFDDRTYMRFRVSIH